MNWRSLAAVAILAATVAGCDKIPVEKIPFIGNKLAPADTAAADSMVTGAPGDTAAAQGDSALQTAEVPPTEAAPTPVAQAPSRPPQPTRPVPQVTTFGEEPWFPTDTGTVAPGMTEDQVVQLWGEPVTDRSMGGWTYMYFRNGCEQSCGTFDVVFFQNGQVVDAIVRGRGHYYSGVSSSPADREAEFTEPVPGATPIGEIG
jgi:hypothetical protein